MYWINIRCTPLIEWLMQCCTWYSGKGLRRKVRKKERKGEMMRFTLSSPQGVLSYQCYKSFQAASPTVRHDQYFREAHLNLNVFIALIHRPSI